MKEVKNKVDPRMAKILKFNEWLWLIFVVVSVIMTTYSLIIKDREQAIYFLVLIFLSGFFYSFKRRQRKRYEGYSNSESEGEKNQS